MAMSRRELLVGALGCVAAGGAATPVTALPFPEGTAFVVLPAGAPPDGGWPLLVALHGRGEARKGPERGGRGWPEDYALLRAIDRVGSPPLVPADLEGFVDPARLAALNDDLAARPYRGLAIACPYVPDLEMYDDAALDAYGAWLCRALLPRLRRELPVRSDAASTGLDGVSLGGRIALHVGLAAPDTYGAVGAIQPALRPTEVERWTNRAVAARARRPDLALRLLTSDGDFFRPAIEATSTAWTAAGVAHEAATVPGPHDYAFNRGPGAIELLRFHDRALRR
jgi:hypothetical protein